MKLRIPILMFSLCTISAIAKPVHNKTTAVKKRIIATSYFANGYLIDSNRYYYSYGRGSEHTNAESYYDNYLRGSEEEQNIHCDSTVNYINYGGTSIIRSSNKTYKYNNNNLPDNFVFTNTGNYKQYCNITRNAAGKPTTISFRDTSGAGAQLSNYTRYLNYNTAGYLVTDSSYNTMNNTPYLKRITVYDANNNDTLLSAYSYKNGSWALTGIIRKTFDANNRLIRKIAQKDTGTGLHYTQTDSFGYRGTDTSQNYHVVYNWDANISQWVGVEKYNTYFSTNKLTDTILIQKWNSSWDTLERIITYYDTDGLIQYGQSYKYNGGGVYASAPYDRTSFYFQTYNPASIITTEKVAGIIVSPNPSKGIMAVKTNNATFSHIIITDMQGRIAFSQSQPETDNAIINTQLSTGTYILSIHDKQGTKITSSQIIIQ